MAPVAIAEGQGGRSSSAELFKSVRGNLKVDIGRSQDKLVVMHTRDAIVANRLVDRNAGSSLVARRRRRSELLLAMRVADRSRLLRTLLKA